MKKIKYAWQRVVRGWDDQALWNLDGYLAELIKDVTFKLSEEGCGFPSGLDEAKWNKVLKEISFGFGSYLEMTDGNYLPSEPEYKRLEKEYKKGMKLFVKYFGNLWD